MEAYIVDSYRRAVEAASGGKNTVIRDKNGNPSVMVVVPKFRLEDIDPGLGTGVHPAFIVHGKEMSLAAAASLSRASTLQPM